MGSLSNALKRLADASLAAIGLFFSTPVWMTISLAILLNDGWPVLYTQPRVGLGRRVFLIYKFRSMIRDAERYTQVVYATHDDPRITRVGRILRKTALDELPQLLNILKGDISWVGPRPARPEEVVGYLRDIPRYDERHRARPGLTGLAQVYGRDYADIREKLAYDLQYVEHRTLLLDFRLCVRSCLNTALGRWDAARLSAEQDSSVTPGSV
jgi:lipopolysaccharide/colanic/teichoic acid biosynthesis glycosyltransferase